MAPVSLGLFVTIPKGKFVSSSTPHFCINQFSLKSLLATLSPEISAIISSMSVDRKICSID